VDHTTIRRLKFDTQGASFDIELFFGFRAEGPAIYLAQPEGLGTHANAF
jgi:hypothetical protein